MKQIANLHACPKRAVYSDLGNRSNVSLSVIGSYPSRATPSSHLRQAFIRTQFNSVASIFETRYFATTDAARRGRCRCSQTTLSTSTQKLPRVFRCRRGPGYEVVVFEKLIT